MQPHHLQNRRLLFYTLFLVFTCMGIIGILPGPTLSLLVNHTRVSLEVGGWLFTVMSAGYMLGVVVAGATISRTGAKYMLMAGLGIMAVSSIVISLAHLFFILLTAWLLVGIGLGLLDVSFNIVIA